MLFYNSYPLLSLLLYYHIIITSSLNCSYQSSPNNYASNIILYDDTSNFLPNSQIHTFQITLNFTYTEMPDIIMGISGYQGNNQISKEFFTFYLILQSLSSFSIDVMTISPTRIHYAKANYMVIEDKEGVIETIGKEFSIFTEISEESISQKKTQVLAFDPSIEMIDQNWRAQYFLNGIYFRATQNIGISFSEMRVTSQKIIELQVTAQAETLIQRLYFLFVLVAPSVNSTLPQQFYLGSHSVLFSDPTSLIFTLEIPDSLLIIGLSAFQSTTISTSIKVTQQSMITSFLKLQFDTFDSLISKYSFNYLIFQFTCCDQDQFWNPENSSCVQNCQLDETSDPVDSICLSCSISCKTCGSEPSECLSCFQGYNLLETTCKLENRQQDNKTEQNNFPIKQLDQNQNLLFLLFLCGLIPLLIIFIIIYCICRQRNKVAPNFHLQIKQHPTIQM